LKEIAARRFLSPNAWVGLLARPNPATADREIPVLHATIADGLSRRLQSAVDLFHRLTPRRSCSSRCAVASVVLLMIATAPVVAQPAGFIEEVVVDGLNYPVGVAFRPGTDRMYIWEKGGVIRIAEDGELLPDPLLDLSDEVNIYWTRGMTGLALDPDFENNGFIYLAYTVDWEYYITGGDPDPTQLDTNHDTFGRIVRYTLDPQTDFTTVMSDSRWEMIGDSHDNGFAVTFASHTQDTIVFAPDGSMLISAGDGASMLEIDTGGVRNPCCSSNTAEADGILPPKEQIGAWRAQLLDSHSGKILRIDPTTADGLPDNPFFDAGAPSSPRSRVWVLGLRNPYTFSVRPGTGGPEAGGGPGVLVIGDVGWDKWERLVVAKQGGLNFGWPKFEGLTPSTGYPSSNTANLDAPNPLFDGGTCLQEYFPFPDLLVQETLDEPSWPNDCDPDQQIPDEFTFMHTRAVLIWRNSRVFPNAYSMVPIFGADGEALAVSITSPDSPVTGPHIKGVATVGGVFFTSDKFPPEYRDWYYFAEAGSPGSDVGWINRARFDENHDLVEVDLFRETDTISPTSLVMDPEGYGLYYANHEVAGLGQIRRITFDCNGNGVGDDIDIHDGTSADANANGIPDECECVGDLDGTGVVDVSDLLILLGAWGGANADLTGDGTTDVADLLALLAVWGEC
jgi:glucose/arabinose dehydrogenase